MSHNNLQDRQSKPNQDSQKTRILLNKADPDRLSGGQIADIQRLKQKKLKDLKINHGTGYLPIEKDDIPEDIYIQDRPSDALKSKLDALYKFVDLEKEQANKYKKKLEKERDLEQEQNDRFNQIVKRDQKEEKQTKYKKDEQQPPESLAQMEMGIQSDGQAMNSGGFQGLGYNDKVHGSNEEMFDRFRQKQSNQYHQNAEDRSHTRDKVETCYKCNLPGHIAKDCKYGLT